MLKRILFSLGFSLVFGVGLFAQSGTIQGVVTDKSTKEPLPFVNVVAMVSGLQKGGAATDFDGNYTIKPLEPGIYDVVVSAIGYHKKTTTNVRVQADKIVFVNVQLDSEMVDIQGVEIVEYEVPLIQKDKTQSGGTVTSEEIAKMPEKSIAAVAASVGGVFSRDGDEGSFSLRGQRSSGTVYYIDGVRVTGSTAIPQSAFDQVSVILGGLPAQYGDVTGGVISVTTKGPSRDFGMGLEYQTSGFGEKRGLDAFGYNRVGINLTGPLIKSKNPNDPSSILGYFLAAEATYSFDGSPKMTGVWTAKDDYIDYLLKNPYRVNNEGTGVWPNASFVTADDIYHKKADINSPYFAVSGTGKIDIKTAKNMNLTLGGRYAFSRSQGGGIAQQMFTPYTNGISTSQTWNVYTRLYHRFNTGEDAILQNVYYQLMVDYTSSSAKSQHPEFKDDLFSYGYIGKYERSRYKYYLENSSVTVMNDTIPVVYAGVREFKGFMDSLVTFTRGELNPYLANYMEQYYNLFPSSLGHYGNIDDIIANGGMLNGSGLNSIYNLFSAPGTSQNRSYSFRDNQQFGVGFKLNADIKKHSLQFGFQFEQKINANYGISAYDFWTYMRQFVNSHISELDLANPILRYNEDNIFLGVVDYNYLYNGDAQFKIDRSLRSLLGLKIDGTEWIDVDSYDPVNNTMNYYDNQGKYVVGQINGKLTSSMFSTDELIDNGLVSYVGYDAYGNKNKGIYSVSDFLTNNDDSGYRSRPIGAVRPNYLSLYLQDVFSFRDLIFNVGVRIDRFDANQEVLKDPYLLFPAYTVGDMKNNPSKFSDFVGKLPSSVGDDYVVYIDNIKEPGKLMGFRSGNAWYDETGTYITDPESILNAGNGVTPYIVDNTNTNQLSGDVFTDYKPQWNVMPRISFSFPISDDALFFAHYDILTQRPTSYATLSVKDYYYMITKSPGTSGINNPNLKPETTIDYEMGYQQRLTNSSSLTLSAFYREIRNQIQIYRLTAAYPKTYYSFENLDFGTVKGLTLTYDLRRTKNMRLKASYTLQFSSGTGSDATAMSSIVTSGQPNLRTLTPTNEDQRHAINVNFDYRFGEGKQYNGPKTVKTDKDGNEKTIFWLQNTGLNVVFRGGTGTPYTRAKTSYSMINGSRVINGSINGARMPASFRIDLVLDRDFSLSSTKAGRSHYLNVALSVQNLLNSANVLSVYSFTGNPGNDGYLNDDLWKSLIQQEINEQSFRLLYSIACNNPNNYSGPRTIRLAVSYNF